MVGSYCLPTLLSASTKSFKVKILMLKLPGNCSCTAVNLKPGTQSGINSYGNEKSKQRVGVERHIGKKRAGHGEEKRDEKKKKSLNGLILSHTRLREVEK